MGSTSALCFSQCSSGASPASWLRNAWRQEEVRNSVINSPADLEFLIPHEWQQQQDTWAYFSPEISLIGTHVKSGKTEASRCFVWFLLLMFLIVGGISLPPFLFLPQCRKKLCTREIKEKISYKRAWAWSAWTPRFDKCPVWKKWGEVLNWSELFLYLELDRKTLVLGGDGVKVLKQLYFPLKKRFTSLLPKKGVSVSHYINDTFVSRWLKSLIRNIGLYLKSLQMSWVGKFCGNLGWVGLHFFLTMTLVQSKFPDQTAFLSLPLKIFHHTVTICNVLFQLIVNHFQISDQITVYKTINLLFFCLIYFPRQELLGHHLLLIPNLSVLVHTWCPTTHAKAQLKIDKQVWFWHRSPVLSSNALQFQVTFPLQIFSSSSLNSGLDSCLATISKYAWLYAFELPYKTKQKHSCARIQCLWNWGLRKCKARTSPILSHCFPYLACSAFSPK